MGNNTKSPQQCPLISVYLEDLTLWYKPSHYMQHLLLLHSRGVRLHRHKELGLGLIPGLGAVFVSFTFLLSKHWFPVTPRQASYELVSPCLKPKACRELQIL